MTTKVKGETTKAPLKSTKTPVKKPLVAKVETAKAPAQKPVAQKSTQQNIQKTAQKSIHVAETANNPKVARVVQMASVKLDVKTTAKRTENSCRIIAVVNQKGGVGKTTTTVNLATALAAAGKRVLIVDFDPQGNATTAFGIDKSKCKQSVYNALVEGVGIESVAYATGIGALDILPSDVDLSAAEIELDQIDNREFVLKQHLATVQGKYDYIFIDCPPSLGLLTVNALACAHSIMIPIQCEFYALEGLSHLIKTYQIMKKNINNKLEIEGAVLTMYDKRCEQTRVIEAEVRRFLGDKVYKAVIHRNVRLAEAPSHGIPGVLYDLNSVGASNYIALAKEILDSAKKSQKKQAA